MPYTVCNVNSNGVFQVLKKSLFFYIVTCNLYLSVFTEVYCYQILFDAISNHAHAQN